RRGLLVAGGAITGLVAFSSWFFLLGPGNNRMGGTASLSSAVIYTYAGHRLKGQQGLKDITVFGVTWSPDSKRIICLGTTSAGENDFTAQVWDARDGGHAITYHLPQPLSGGIGNTSQGGIRAADVCWRSGSPLIVSAGRSGLVTIVDLDSSNQIMTYRGH